MIDQDGRGQFDCVLLTYHMLFEKLEVCLLGASPLAPFRENPLSTVSETGEPTSGALSNR
jgi:hypothetical protein